MQSALVVHGSTGSKDGHWLPWLKQKLEERGLKVFLPQFPISEGQQTLNNWLNILKPIKEQLTGSIMIGHSMGVPFILNVIDLWDVKIKGAFLVAGFAEKHEAKGEPNMDDFSARDFHWKRIKNNCEKFYVFHSDNDPYVPLEKAQRLAKNLDVDVTLIKGAGHFQVQSGFKTFEFLLQKIDEVIEINE